MTVFQSLVDSLDQTQNYFLENELAYLALTSKIEKPLRNKVAFLLQQELMPDKVASREWKYCDLAILEDTDPIALIEFKAMYHFDVFLNGNKTNKFKNYIDSDIEKSHKIAKSNTQIFSVLLSTNPTDRVHQKYQGIIKYRNGINRAIKEADSPEKIDRVVASKVNDWFPNIKTHTDKIECGEYFRVKTEIRYWVMGPFN